jgi:hypothetical protein
VIPRLHERTHRAREPLAEALGRPVSAAEGLTEYTIVAHWPGLDSCTVDDEQETWTSVQWVEHLEELFLVHPLGTGPDGDRRAILHFDVRLRPGDRALTGPEWAETAHRLARAVGIEVPGAAEHGWRWIAVQAQSGRLDLIANLLHIDGTWRTSPVDILRRLSDEARRIEQDLRLVPARTATTRRSATHAAPTASAQLASVLAQLADEQAGPLAAVRGLVEHTAHRIARQPSAAGADTAHRLEWIAQRLHAIQQDLDTTAARLAQSPAVPVRAGVRGPLHRSL